MICPTRLVLMLAISTSAARAADWPQILGPDRNGVAGGDEKIVDAFPVIGPKILWTVKVGQGHAGPAVAGEKLILFHRIENRETVECLDAASGQRQWLFDLSHGLPR